MWETYRGLREPVSRAGHGVHSGRPCSVRLRPAELESGLRLQVGNDGVAIDVAAVHDVGGGCTALRCGDEIVLTVEHLLAALVVAGITDVIIQVEGGEVPILDGSASEWAMALAEAGLEEAPHRRIAPSKAVEVESWGGRASWTPGPVDEVVVHVDFEGGPRGTGHWRAGGPAPLAARTFVRARDVDRLRAEGRGRGASPRNTWILTDESPGNEAVQHLLLDAIGDRALGGLVRGRAELFRPSHRLSHALWRAVAEAG